jgi:hypothetical protein
MLSGFTTLKERDGIIRRWHKIICTHKLLSKYQKVTIYFYISVVPANVIKRTLKYLAFNTQYLQYLQIKPTGLTQFDCQAVRSCIANPSPRVGDCLANRPN